MSEFSIELQVTAEFCQEHHLIGLGKRIPLEWLLEADDKQTGRVYVPKYRFCLENAIFYGYINRW